MSGSQEVTMIVDLDSSSASFSSRLRFEEDPAWYGGKAAYEPMEMNISFHGTSISFYGSVEQVRVTLDDNEQVSLPGSINKRTVWYQSPSLSDEEHNFAAVDSGTYHMYIDYALVKAGSTTDLSAKTIFVDNAKEDEIWYTGQWFPSVDSQFVYDPPNGPSLTCLAADRTATYSNTTGDSFEFRFSGTSISVYGILLAGQNFTVDFIMDDSGAKRGEYPQDGPHGFDNDEIVNYKFYEATTLDPGNHTLIVNVTNIVNGSRFVFDYVTYTPSFSFVHEKPDFIRGSGDQNVTPSSGVLAQSSQLPIGATVGIVIAVLSVITITGLFYHCRRKRSTLRREGDSKPKSTKWRELFRSEDTANSDDPMDERGSHLTPQRVPRNMTEVQQRSYDSEIASLTAEMQNSDNPTRGELFTRINMLTMELERVVRENAPPEYGGSDVGQTQRPTGTLPSYHPRDGV
ncbi:hypothetical protein VNI00_018562 [Paramarasmius palmivorus]|uniref:Uncharacterized protein n=1 Tax=Paramarasmius palmivorus TaxID=297713 RepID=A0AAW0AWN7_9AGAR